MFVGVLLRGTASELHHLPNVAILEAAVSPPAAALVLVLAFATGAARGLVEALPYGWGACGRGFREESWSCGGGGGVPGRVLLLILCSGSPSCS